MVVADPPPTFALHGVVQGYRDIEVLSGLDLVGGIGVIGVLGPNGAGKTTLLDVLCTRREPRAGSVDILGLTMSDAARRRIARRRMGVLPQRFGYLPHFTVHEFVQYCGWLREMPSSSLPGAAALAVDRVGLSAMSSRKMRTLSGGMLRRAGIAQAIVNEPALLILDEPTVGLDPEQRITFRELLRNLGESGCVVVATHLVEDVAAACDDVIVLVEGRVKFRGPPVQLAAAATAGAIGDTPLERGYSAVVGLESRER